jgi:hypothetical protein
MTEDILKQRRMAMEQIFHQRDQELLKQLRASMNHGSAEAQQRDQLREMSGIDDHEVLDKLIALDVAPETFAAMSLIPLVRVAWADLRIQGPERDAILKAATAGGIAENSPAYRMLESWLESPPTRELLEAWKAYIQALLADVSAADRALLRDSLVERARSIAAAAGGILGLGAPVAICEQVVLDELASAFDA